MKVGAHLGLNRSLSSWFSKSIRLGNNKIMFRPSSMIGLWQNEQRILQGSLCSMDFSVGSYHSKSWCPFEKLTSSLWKMAAHCSGAAIHEPSTTKHDGRLLEKNGDETNRVVFDRFGNGRISRSRALRGLFGIELFRSGRMQSSGF